MDFVLPQLVDRFASLRVLVLGESIVDIYLDGTTSRICREAPVPVVALRGRRHAPGGAANVAANLRALGSRVTLASVLGDDAEASALRSSLSSAGIGGHGLVSCRERRTLAKTRVTSSSQILLRIDQGTTTPLGEPVESELITRIQELWPDHDAVIVSDYGQGLITARVAAAVADLQQSSARILAVDSRHRLGELRHLRPTLVKPNFEELSELLGGFDRPEKRVREVQDRADEVIVATGARIVAATLDTDGAVVLERGQAPYRTWARPREQCRTTGAGDSYLSAFTLAMAAGGARESAAEIAAAAADIAICKEGTAVCNAAELRARLLGDEKFVPTAEGLDDLAGRYRRQGRSLVFTNGCFDLLHSGHIEFLRHARSLGDVLIVGVNTDDSIRRLKGPGRPISTLADRLRVLSALQCIDHLATFDDDTSESLIEAVRPDVFVKGGNYTKESIPEAPLVEALGGRVVILPCLSHRSTSGIIQRIQLEIGTAALSIPT